MASGQPLSVFVAYSHRDEALRDALETHLAVLRHEGAIRNWHDRRIGPGWERQGEIDGHLESADLVLFLISASFIASDYCFDREMQRAFERHAAGEARVVPVILRPTDWQYLEFAHLQAMPRGGKPITIWRDQDQAFVDVARGLRSVVVELRSTEQLLVQSIPWGDHLLQRLKSDGAELIRLRQEARTGRWHLQIRLPAELRDLYGTASEVLLLAAADEIRGEDLKLAEEELLRREYDLDPDLLIVADGSPGLEERLARIYQLWGQWVPWPLIDGALPPLAEQFRPYLSVYDIFDRRLPARGRQVIGRSGLVADLSRRLQAGQSLGVFGLRKIGKTTICRAVTDKLDPASRASKPELGLHWGRATAPVIWLDVQELCERTLESLASQLVRDLERRLAIELLGQDRVWMSGNPLRDLNRLLERVLQQARRPIVVVFDEYDLLFESESGEPAIAGIDQLFRMFRAHAQAQEPSRLAVVVIGRDSEFFDRPKMNGRPNPMLNWFVPRWLGPMEADDADELLSRLGRRVGLEIGEKTKALARRWTGGHPLLHRELGSALLEVARSRRRAPGHIATDPFCDQAIDLFVDRDHVLTTLREVFFLLAKRYPEASLKLHNLSRAPARGLKEAIKGAGGWHLPAIRTLRKFGLLLGSPDEPYIPELLRWYSRTFIPDLDQMAV